MKRTFYCTDCEQTFNDSGKKETWESKVYGPMSQYVANCPKCKQKTKETVKPLSSSGSTESASSCATGTCPFVN